MNMVNVKKQKNANQSVQIVAVQNMQQTTEDVQQQKSTKKIDNRNKLTTNTNRKQRTNDTVKKYSEIVKTNMNGSAGNSKSFIKQNTNTRNGLLDFNAEIMKLFNIELE